MPGLIEELTTQASDPSSDVTNLLLRMKVAAVRLKLGEPQAWVNQELAGYPDEAPLPEYRFIFGVPQSQHSHWGWRNLTFSDNADSNLLMSHVQYRGDLAGLQSLAAQGESMRLSYPRFIEEAVLPHLPYGVRKVGLFVGRPVILSALSAIRNKVLDWSLEMEAAGVTGEGMSFTQQEKTVAQHVNYNFDMRGDHNRANINSVDSSINTVVYGQLFGDIRAKIEAEISEPETKEAVKVAVADMEAQKTKGGFMAAYGKFMQAAANHVQVVQPFVERIGELLKALPDTL